MPAGAKLITPPDTVIVSCAAPVEVLEEEAGGDASAEPEVIGQKETEEGADE